MTARYREIADELRERIESGEYPPGSKLPGYEALTSTYSVGRGVIRDALSVLQVEGLIRVAKKSGITVREPGERRRVTRGNTVTRDPLRGYIFPAASRPDEPWQVHGQPRRSFEAIPAEVAIQLGVDAGSEVLRRRRVTSPAGESPFQLIDTWIHPDGVTDAPQVAEPSTGLGGYLDRLEEAGHGPVVWTEILRGRMPTPDETRQLDIPAAMPVLVITRVGVSARTKQPIEVTACVIPTDRVEVVTELRRDRASRWPVTPVQVPEAD